VGIKFKPGDYVHIPSKVMMLFYEKKDQEGEWYWSSTAFKKTVILETPQKLMFVNSPHPEFCEVFYKGSLWTVPSRHVYESGE
jgi:hypothetical protein